MTYLGPHKKGEIEKWEIPEVQFPEDNPYSDASIELGSILYSENLFSQDTSISCQSCHMPHMAFAEQLIVSEGVFNRKVTRNAPTLMNIGLHPHLMRDGKFKSLEEQVLGPLADHREFNLHQDSLIARLKTVPYYNEMSLKAYNSELTIEVVQKSLANFQRIVVSKDTPFDAYMKGDKKAISSSAKKGYELFKSDRLSCIKCHSGFDFTDYSFQNNGTYEVFKDSGRALISQEQTDIGKFKVPTLRNLNLTFPYMHDGSFETLDEVINHYESGGKENANKSEFIKGFELSKKERQNLLDFLSSLTEYRFIEEY